MKTRVRCQRTQPTDAFSPHTRTRDRLHPQCRTCRAELARAYYAANRTTVLAEQRGSERRRAYNREYARRRKYGISRAEYEAIVEAQGGCCAICGVDGLVLAVDHCHRTGVIRGLVCGGCNLGLGHFGDDPARLRAAAAYLEGDAPPLPCARQEGCGSGLSVSS